MRLVHREELPEEQGQDCEAVRGGYSYTGVIEVVYYETRNKDALYGRADRAL